MSHWCGRYIYVFSGPTEYEVYAKTDTLKDEKLGIEVPLSDIFPA